MTRAAGGAPTLFGVTTRIGTMWWAASVSQPSDCQRIALRRERENFAGDFPTCKTHALTRSKNVSWPF